MAKFLVPSVIGIILFMIPVKYNGDWTVCVKILADIIGGALGGFLPILCVAIITVSAIMSVISLAKPKFITEHPILNDTFSTSIIWVVVRVIGAALVWLTYLGLDAEDGKTGFLHMLTEGGAGGFVLGDLLTVLVIIFAIAALLFAAAAGLWSIGVCRRTADEGHEASVQNSWTCGSRLLHFLDWRRYAGCHADLQSIRRRLLFCKRSLPSLRRLSQQYRLPSVLSFCHRWISCSTLAFTTCSSA